MAMEKRTRSKSAITKPKATDHVNLARAGPVKKKVKATTSTKTKAGKSKTKTTPKTTRTVRTVAKAGTRKKTKFSTNDPSTLLKYDFERVRMFQDILRRQLEANEVYVACAEQIASS